MGDDNFVVISVRLFLSSSFKSVVLQATRLGLGERKSQIISHGYFSRTLSDLTGLNRIKFSV